MQILPSVRRWEYQTNYFAIANHAPKHFASLLAQVVDLICSSLREGVWLLLSFFGGFVLRFLVGAPPVCFLAVNSPGLEAHLRVPPVLI